MNDKYKLAIGKGTSPEQALRELGKEVEAAYNDGYSSLNEIKIYHPDLGGPYIAYKELLKYADIAELMTLTFTKPEISNEQLCGHCLSRPAQPDSYWCAECDRELTQRDADK